MRNLRDAAAAGVLALVSVSSVSVSSQDRQASIRRECLVTLPVLADALLSTQIIDKASPDHGALRCPEDGALHTRAAEAVYPFAVMFRQTGDARYLRGAVALGNWLTRQQGKDGEWAETPWTWTGTTADQVLMLGLAYPIIEPQLTPAERQAWRTSIERATRYLVERMNPDFATINYCATTPATLAVVHRLFPDAAYLPKARTLARQVLSRMTSDGFIEGEAARVGAVKYGVDPGYEMDMSFWGLTLYAQITGDTLVADRVKHAVATHLSLVYPNGMIDGSWGARCYKWTTFGSKTADGSQVLFSLLASDDSRYRTAAIRNLEYLRTMIRGGFVTSGPHADDVSNRPPCLYATFARAKNLAMAAELGEQGAGPLPPLPSDRPGLLTVYPSVNVALARTERFMVTVSAYHYVDQMNWGEGRYSQFPGGGSAANVWVDGIGLLQTSSPTRYVRGEVIHMPEITTPIRPLTPRVEYSANGDLFTNLYERAGQFSAAKSGDGHAHTSVAGALKNERLLPGGVAYRLSHDIGPDTLTKRVELRYHDAQPVIDIVEPIVEYPAMRVARRGPRQVDVQIGERTVTIELLAGQAEFVLGEQRERFWQPFPAIRAFPIVLRVRPPARPFEDHAFETAIEYRLTVAPVSR